MFVLLHACDVDAFEYSYLVLREVSVVGALVLLHVIFRLRRLRKA